MRTTRLPAQAGLIILVAILCASYVGYRFAETLYPDPAALQTIIPGLSHSNVVHRLGVMYDSVKPGEYAGTGKVLSGMQRPESIARLCVWRVRHSRDRFWVGFDDADAVVSAGLEDR